MNIKMSTKKPTKPGTYILQVPWKATEKYRNSRLADVCMIANFLMVYCLDSGIHKALDECPNDYRWSEEIFQIEGDSRLN